jgi:hypothetical protein
MFDRLALSCDPKVAGFQLMRTPRHMIFPKGSRLIYECLCRAALLQNSAADGSHSAAVA